MNPPLVKAFILFIDFPKKNRPLRVTKTVKC